MMKFNKILAAALALSAVPAMAQVAGVTVGATVYDPQGGEVGTIASIDGSAVTIDTGTNKAAVGADVFGAGEKGPMISMTRDQLNAAIEQSAARAAAELDAALVAGAMLHSADNVMLGTVQSVAEDKSSAVVDITDHGPVTVKKEQLAVTNGQLTFLATEAQLRAALGG